ncbi:hypothetical protein K458DRAFT_206968 [Lentithecium fluviatile CBS 122367]|uniref:Secreted protein n=1 Tax=Lentithecium fluviatile CBS 122367 TaxID=1168545 RepID=A0A6G1J602_9PLEO|nr:hypothetical protein K458DRAFT_206968 [Lentithecium fluviatile CBS 122367]
MRWWVTTRRGHRAALCLVLRLWLFFFAHFKASTSFTRVHSHGSNYCKRRLRVAKALSTPSATCAINPENQTPWSWLKPMFPRVKYRRQPQAVARPVSTSRVTKSAADAKGTVQSKSFAERPKSS